MKRESIEEIQTVQSQFMKQMQKINNQSLVTLSQAFSELILLVKENRLSYAEKQLLGHIENDTLHKVTGNKINEVIENLNINNSNRITDQDGITKIKLKDLKVTLRQQINQKINTLFEAYDDGTLFDNDSSKITKQQCKIRLLEFTQYKQKLQRVNDDKATLQSLLIKCKDSQDTIQKVAESQLTQIQKNLQIVDTNLKTAELQLVECQESLQQMSEFQNTVKSKLTQCQKIVQNRQFSVNQTRKVTQSHLLFRIIQFIWQLIKYVLIILVAIIIFVANFFLNGWLWVKLIILVDIIPGVRKVYIIGLIGLLLNLCIPSDEHHNRENYDEKIQKIKGILQPDL